MLCVLCTENRTMCWARCIKVYICMCVCSRCWCVRERHGEWNGYVYMCEKESTCIERKRETVCHSIYTCMPVYIPSYVGACVTNKINDTVNSRGTSTFNYALFLFPRVCMCVHPLPPPTTLHPYKYVTDTNNSKCYR